MIIATLPRGGARPGGLRRRRRVTMYIYIYIYTHMCIYIYIYTYLFFRAPKGVARDLALYAVSHPKNSGRTANKTCTIN